MPPASAAKAHRPPAEQSPYHCKIARLRTTRMTIFLLGAFYDSGADELRRARPNLVRSPVAVALPPLLRSPTLDHPKLEFSASPRRAEPVRPHRRRPRHRIPPGRTPGQHGLVQQNGAIRDPPQHPRPPRRPAKAPPISPATNRAGRWHRDPAAIPLDGGHKRQAGLKGVQSRLSPPLLEESQRCVEQGSSATTPAST